MPAPASLETQSDAVLRDRCNTYTGQENSSGASNQMHFRFIAREVDATEVDVPVAARNQDVTFQRALKTVEAPQAQSTDGVVDVVKVIRNHGLALQRVQKTVLAPRANKLEDVPAMTLTQAPCSREFTRQCWRRKRSAPLERWTFQWRQTRPHDAGHPRDSADVVVDVPVVYR